MADLPRILHVDDDEDILEITRMALQMVDVFEMKQVSSGAAALARLDTWRPDLLLLDVMLPGMSGPELWLEVRRRPALSHLPAIFMTAKAEGQVSAALLAQGALDVITKPYDPMTLGNRVRMAWARQVALGTV